MPNLSSTNSSASELRAVTPSDTVDIPIACRLLRIHGAGDVNVLALGDVAPVIITVPADTELKIMAKRVYQTGTTATGIVAFA